MTYKRIDANQNDIVKALRAHGASVHSLAAIGKGCPDLLVGYNGYNFLMEIKDGTKPQSARKLTPDQISWHEAYRGAVHIVTDVDGALAVISLALA